MAEKVKTKNNNTRKYKSFLNLWKKNSDLQNTTALAGKKSQRVVKKESDAKTEKNTKTPAIKFGVLSRIASKITGSSRKNMPNETKPEKRKYVRRNYKTSIKVPTKIQTRLSKTLIFSSGIAFSVMFIYIPSTFYSWYHSLPKPEMIDQIVVSNRPTRILDRKGKPLYEIYVDKKYDPVQLERVPKNIVAATLAIEDDSFYTHKGIRPLSIMRAAKATMLDDSLQGGSTITQQLVKNVLLSSERTYTRKIKEVFISLAVEKRYTKNEILELYLNNIPYGGTAWGIESASQKFFGKTVSDLNLAEGAFLAGLPSAPSVYSPYSGNIDAAKERQKVVLNRMHELGYITAEEKENALKEELHFSSNFDYIRAPHFVAYVREQLEAIYGKRLTEVGGLTVRTTLDLDLQEKVEQIVREEVEKSKDLNISNGAVVVIDPKTAQILAYVGSMDYYKEGWGAFDVVTALRQPGSTIKVVTYALALENGYSAASAIVDAPTTIQLGGGKTYSPVNYDGAYHGTVSLRSALANSYNIPAVKLVVSLGPDKMVDLGGKMGLTNWEVGNDYGYSVTLGGKETRLLDLTNVYATLAREGVHEPTTPFISVKDSRGYELYSQSQNHRSQVVSKETAYIMTNILSDNRARMPAFGVSNALTVPNHTVAVKTGTTNDKRDNYTVGYTPSYVVGVWVGNNDNSPMNPYLASGISGAAPIWNRVMNELLQNSPNEEFKVPENVFVKINKDCGIQEVFAKGRPSDLFCPKKPDEDKDKDKEKND